jgi:site-specific DNA-methyltransferase (adenine-specific)
MSKHLKYYWTAAYLTPGQPTPLRQVNVNTTWKPLLIFTNGEYTGKIFGDVFKSDSNSKEFHKWGQSVSGMYDLISKICLPGQYILDPFTGAGTTGMAALMHGCLFDGIDIQLENVNIAKGRLNDTTRI